MSDNILAVRLGGLGDLLIVLPSIQLIKKKKPHARIILVARLNYGLLLKEAGVIDSLLPLEDNQTSFLFQAKEASDQREVNFDLVLIWLNRELPEMERLWRSRFGDELRLIKGPGENKIPLARYFLFKTAEILNISSDEESEIEESGQLPVKEYWQEDAKRNFPWLRNCPYVIIHPGSGGSIKRWKLENFLGLIDFFVDRRIGGIFITGPAEEDYFSVLSTYRWPENWDWVHEPGLNLICGLLSKALLYIGNDSGITHLAAFCGCPGLAFFRQENFPLWSPYNERIKLIIAADLNQIGINSVLEAIRELLGKGRKD